MSMSSDCKSSSIGTKDGGHSNYYQMQSSLLTAIEQTRALVREVVDSADGGDSKSSDNNTLILSYPTTLSTGNDKPSLQSSSSSSSTHSSFTLLTLHQDLLQHRIDRLAMSRVVRAKLADCGAHLERLRSRVADRSSRILVTGDVNAGKSTLVNALLRRPNLMPTDQQPCTQSFCEVIIDFSGGGGGGVSGSKRSLSIRAQSDPLFSTTEASTETLPESTDNRMPFHKSASVLLSLEEMQNDLQNEHPQYPWYQLTLTGGDCEAGALAPSPLLSHNGINATNSSTSPLSFALIDSPGLNSDLFSKAKVFAHQDDLDAIIFVVNAANHLTLSAREFLERAAREKAFIFVVVNKFDEIGNQDKCRRIVLQQISQVLPLTHQHADELVHFVSARVVLERYITTITTIHQEAPSPKFTKVQVNDHHHHNSNSNKDGDPFKGAFEQCERALCLFLLEKRARSKLLPAKTYLQHLLADLECLLAWNLTECHGRLEAIGLELEMITPCYEDLVSHEAPLRHDLHSVIGETRRQVQESTQRILGSLLLDEDDNDGYPRSDSCSSDTLGAIVEGQPLSGGGLWQVWAWRETVFERVEQHSHQQASQARQAALEAVTSARHLLHHTAISHAPKAVFEGLSLTSNSPDFFIDQLPPPLVIPRPAAWDLIPLPSWSLSVSTITSSWIGAATLGGAIFGYQPLISIGFRLVEVLLMRQARRETHRSSSGKTLLFFAATTTAVVIMGSVAVWVGSRNLEGLLRKRIMAQCRQAITEDWVEEHVRALDEGTTSALTTTTSTLLARFEEALLRQRRLRAQKDLERCQTESLLTRLQRYRERVGQLQGRIQSIEGLH